MRSVKGKLQSRNSEFGLWNLAAIVFLLLSLSLSSIAQSNIPDQPNPPRLVNDFAGMLADDENQQLEGKLVAYNDSTSTQITIVIMNTLDGAEPSQYATELGQKWGVGQKGKDNGVVILVSKEEHKIFIAPGRGIEEYLPDAICKRIVENTLKPAFRNNSYYTGLDEATDEMIGRLQGTFVQDKDDKDNPIPTWIIISLIILIFFILPLIFRNRGGGTTFSSGGFGGGPFLGGGGFGGGGGGGGGFGGFGGGGFGGGGAGGSW